ncbi:Rec8 like protein-domain-containing protein [Schizothecium vesticola]|uniref:Rec8 like protein-domain-containing protein n=1 Tax=Schizothecium vesticola TaxID=314040 RepID=A0AA40F1L5_9PEZI|nr:Rec8 like protein-domain-containing protein [Schizothecium vesticola]
MFYSHEILTNQRYGVATVWLVSTVGLRSAAKKISKKAILEVDVEKACETILQPGAPIALRLQGNLLFGVSRVYSQQCTYVLTDAEKTQAHMRAFYNSIQYGNALDPEAGKARREQLVLEDDPEFDINSAMPAFFQFDDDGNTVIPDETQDSRKTSSQMSPRSGSKSSSFESGGGSFLGGLEFPGSSQPQTPLRTIGTLGSANASVHKMADRFLLPEKDDEINPDISDWGIELDADGNLVEMADEPELPKLPRPRPERKDEIMEQEAVNPFLDDQQDVNMGADNHALPEASLLPDAQPFSPRAQPTQAEQDDEDFNLTSPEKPDKSILKTRRRRCVVMDADASTKVARSEIRAWNTDYLVHTERARKKARHRTTAAEYQKNAYSLVFGRGVTHVGLPVGDPRILLPLASTFSGRNLERLLLGFAIGEDQPEVPRGRGRRRPALEALELESEDAERRVRPRLSDDSNNPPSDHPEPPRAEEDAELGRDALPALPDLPSDAAPWNRHSSQPLRSSPPKPRGLGPNNSSRNPSASPSGHRHRLPSDNIERFSDTNNPTYGSGDGFGGGPPSYYYNSLNSDPRRPPDDPFLLPDVHQQHNTSQAASDALGHEGSNFLSFVETQARAVGEWRAADGRHWVRLEEDLFEPADRTRAVVVQAFYHVLALVTRNAIKVEQDGQGGMVPFGSIRIGVVVGGWRGGQ